jgi:hypothetical protein
MYSFFSSLSLVVESLILELGLKESENGPGQWLMPIILATQEAEIRSIMFKATRAKIKTLSQKHPAHSKKGDGQVAQVVEHLPSKCEALSSNFSARKEGGREGRREGGKMGNNL